MNKPIEITTDLPKSPEERVIPHGSSDPEAGVYKYQSHPVSGVLVKRPEDEKATVAAGFAGFRVIGD